MGSGSVLTRGRVGSALHFTPTRHHDSVISLPPATMHTFCFGSPSVFWGPVADAPMLGCFAVYGQGPPRPCLSLLSPRRGLTHMCVGGGLCGRPHRGGGLPLRRPRRLRQRAAQLLPRRHPRHTQGVPASGRPWPPHPSPPVGPWGRGLELIQCAHLPPAFCYHLKPPKGGAGNCSASFLGPSSQGPESHACPEYPDLKAQATGDSHPLLLPGRGRPSLAAVARLAMVVIVTANLPLIVFPARHALDGLLAALHAARRRGGVAGPAASEGCVGVPGCLGALPCLFLDPVLWGLRFPQ